MIKKLIAFIREKRETARRKRVAKFLNEQALDSHDHFIHGTTSRQAVIRENYGWWNYSLKDYPEDHFQIADGCGWKHPRFIAFSKEDAVFLCAMLNKPNQATIKPEPECNCIDRNRRGYESQVDEWICPAHGYKKR